jgi:hypothetical protein
MMGFEPTTLGTTIQCSDQLSYNHHIWAAKIELFLFDTKNIILFQLNSFGAAYHTIKTLNKLSKPPS